MHTLHLVCTHITHEVLKFWAQVIIEYDMDGVHYFGYVRTRPVPPSLKDVLQGGLQVDEPVPKGLPEAASNKRSRRTLRKNPESSLAANFVCEEMDTDV
jgi:hypothetical protein